MTTPPPLTDEAATSTIANVGAHFDAASVLLNLIAAGYQPAVLIGDWFGADAIIAPHIETSAALPDQLFPTNLSPVDSRWFFGVRPYSGVSFGGFSDSVLTLRDGSWHATNIPASTLQIAFRDETQPQEIDITWDDGNHNAHSYGVESCKESIRAGDVYQACISTRFYGSATTSHPVLHASAHWFAAKVRAHSPARAAFIPGNTSQGLPTVASLSPEEFLIRDGSTVTETPIKGTLPASSHPEELLASEKDVAENIMIVDLVRHDLGRIATTGGVHVTDLLSVRRAPGVWHLFSTVAATIPESLPHAAVIEACFPPASVTGTPKIRAAELIDDWEPVPRGVHCGCIGAAVGNALELNVAIRTAEFFEDDSRTEPDGQSSCPDGTNRIRVELGVGGGITIDSDTEAEWQEIKAKAAPLL